jgi:HlyD family secretion protein
VEVRRPIGDEKVEMAENDQMVKSDWTAWLSPKTWLAPERRRPVLFAGAIAVVALLGIAFFKPEKPAEYKTEAVKIMDLTKSISASGTLQAVESVQIGSQVSGQVLDVYVDFNSQVKKGQLLARIDTAQLQSRVVQSQAALASADATLKQAQADYDRQKRLAAADLVADKDAQDADAARAKAIASVRQAQAQLQSDRANLGYAEIRSPIDGIVINRTVDPGNTVAASFSAPNLFVVANDLSKLEIKIMVDEADIGAVREGQAATFTVDAFPDETFDGQIVQVRKQPVTSANVVTYEVIASANNPGGRLLPGMTANVDVITEQHPNVLAMPMAGLRWKPIDPKAKRLRARPPRRTRSGKAPGAVRAAVRACVSLAADQAAANAADAVFRSINSPQRSTLQLRKRRRCKPSPIKPVRKSWRPCRAQAAIARRCAEQCAPQTTRRMAISRKS